ncbi:hypothetical protein ACQI4E_32590 [Streptomyces sp. CA-252508]
MQQLLTVDLEEIEGDEVRRHLLREPGGSPAAGTDLRWSASNDI